MAGKEGEGCDLAGLRVPSLKMEEVWAGQRDLCSKAEELVDGHNQLKQMLVALMKRAYGAVGQAEVSVSVEAVSETGPTAPTTPPSNQGPSSEDPPRQFERGALEALEESCGQVTRQSVAREAERGEYSPSEGTPAAHLRDLPGGGEGGLSVEQRRELGGSEKGNGGACGMVEDGDGPGAGLEKSPAVVGVPSSREDTDVADAGGCGRLTRKRAPEQTSVDGGAARGGRGFPSRWKKCPAPVGAPAPLRSRRMVRSRPEELRGALRRTAREARRRRLRRDHAGGTLAQRGESSRGPLCVLALGVGGRDSGGRRLAPGMAWEPRPPPWPPPLSPARDPRRTAGGGK